MIGFLLSPFARYAALCVAVVAIVAVIDQRAYTRGYDAARATQAAVDAETYQAIIKEMQNAGVDVSNADAVDCELRRLAGEPESDECRDLRRD